MGRSSERALADYPKYQGIAHSMGHGRYPMTLPGGEEHGRTLAQRRLHGLAACLQLQLTTFEVLGRTQQYRNGDLSKGNDASCSEVGVPVIVPPNKVAQQLQGLHMADSKLPGLGVDSLDGLGKTLRDPLGVLAGHDVGALGVSDAGDNLALGRVDSGLDPGMIPSQAISQGDDSSALLWAEDLVGFRRHDQLSRLCRDHRLCASRQKRKKTGHYL
jgi:hypothetical protein